jgi:hypothetical protein
MSRTDLRAAPPSVSSSCAQLTRAVPAHRHGGGSTCRAAKLASGSCAAAMLRMQSHPIAAELHPSPRPSTSRWPLPGTGSSLAEGPQNLCTTFPPRLTAHSVAVLPPLSPADSAPHWPMPVAAAAHPGSCRHLTRSQQGHLGPRTRLFTPRSCPQPVLQKQRYRSHPTACTATQSRCTVTPSSSASVAPLVRRLSN